MTMFTDPDDPNEPEFVRRWKAEHGRDTTPNPNEEATNRNDRLWLWITTSVDRTETEPILSMRDYARPRELNVDDLIRSLAHAMGITEEEVRQRLFPDRSGSEPGLSDKQTLTSHEADERKRGLEDSHD
jgi:hypothetical protein